MDLQTEISQVTALRDKFAAVETPSGLDRDIISRATILIGKLQLKQDEGKVAAAAAADIASQLKKAGRG